MPITQTPQPQVINHGERKHLPFSASQAHRLINCNGPIFYKDILPEQETSETAKEGEKFHETLEILLHDFLEYKVNGTDAYARLESLKNTADDDMLTHAEEAVGIIWKEGLDQFITGKAYGFEDEFILDEKLGIGGIADFWCIYRDKKGQRVALIVDYKYGYNYVDEENNAQLATYASSLRECLLRDGFDIDYARVAIYQPRAGGKVYREFKFTAKALTIWKTKLIKAARRAFIEKKIKLKAGDWCKFCPAMSVCVEYKKNVEENSGLALARETPVPTIDKLTLDQQVKIVTWKDEIEKLLKASYSNLLSLGKKGITIPGMKVVAGVSKRKWKAEIFEIKEVLSEAGIKEPLRSFDPEPITIGDAEKQLKKLLGTEDLAKELLGKLTELSVSSELLVSENDPREGIKSYKQKLLEVKQHDAE